MRKRLREKEEIDPVVKEFEEKDLGEDIKAKDLVLIRPKRKIPTSILLDPELVEKLKTKAGSKGLGYLTLMKMIVYENVDRY